MMHNFDEELLKERAAAKELLYEINHLRPSQHSDKDRLYKKLIGKLGERFLIESPFHCDYGYNIEIGDDFYANVNLVILDGAKVKSAIMCLLHPMLAYTQPVTR